MIEEYLLQRPNLALVFVLVDVRHEPQKIDTDFMQWLGEESVPFSIVFTKADKLGKNNVASNVDSYKKNLLRTWEELPEIFVTSSVEKIGGDAIADFIDHVNSSIAR